MRRINRIVVGTALLLVLALAGCSGGAAPSAAGSSGSASTPVPPAAGNPANAAAQTDYSSSALPTSYDNALPASTQLALGILRLEGTPQAVTPAEAKTLLPLWQAFEGNALQSDTERNAVLKQVEGALSADQVKAIADMKLTNDDMRKWAQDNGMQFMPAGTPGPGGAPGGPGGNLTDAQRQAFRATAEAGGGSAGGGAFNNMTDEQRQAFRATAEAGGGQFRQGGQGQAGQAPGARGTPGAGGNGGRFIRTAAPYRIFVNPLVQLLTKRAAE